MPTPRKGWDGMARIGGVSLCSLGSTSPSALGAFNYLGAGAGRHLIFIS